MLKIAIIFLFGFYVCISVVEVNLSQFWTSIREVKKNYNRYDKWEQDQADDAAKRERLSKTLDLPKDRVELVESKAKTVVRAAEMLDKRSEDNCENMEQSTGLISMAVMFPLIFAAPIVEKKLNLSKAGRRNFAIAQVGVFFATAVGLTLWGNNKQKEASRLGRFQAKQHELKDVKNFVTYTPEQIAAAKVLAKKIPDKNEKKSISKMFKDMEQMSKDKKEYKKWLKEKVKNADDNQKVLNTDFTPKQLAQGEEDKEIIVNIVKDINIKAEEYSENAENAFDTMTMLSFLASAPLGIGLSKILNKTKNFASISKPASALVAALVPIGVLLWGTQEQKKASRVGRFVKRKEILTNPNVLFAYTDEQMQQVKNVKAPQKKKGFFEKIGDNFKFFGRYFKERNEYKKFQKTEAKENEKLYEVLSKTEVSKTQLKEAKHFQEKTFKAFDKVDEMSQRYSEDIEAGTEIAKNSVTPLWSLASITGLAFLAVMGKKGKLPMHKAVKWAADISLDRGSSVRGLIKSGYEIINKDKNLRMDFCKAIFSKNARKNILKNPELRPILAELALKVSNHLPEISKAQDLTQTIREIVTKHFKKDKISKWFRNITVDISKLWTKKKISTLPQKPPKEIMDKLKFNYTNYKTFINSLLVGGVPIAAVVVGVPFAFSSWMTNVQKKAGKIGVMKAVEELDNPKIFVNTQLDSEDEKREAT